MTHPKRDPKAPKNNPDKGDDRYEKHQINPGDPGPPVLDPPEPRGPGPDGLPRDNDPPLGY
jgi:hypothetical protein